MLPNSALLIIDAQIGIIDGPRIGPVFEKEKLIQTLQTVIHQARNKSIPVIYVQDVDVAKPDTKEFQIHEEIAPLEGERVFQKKATDAFHKTELFEYLQSLGVQHVIIGGCKTEFCIDTTCRRATTLGLDVTLLSDGHSTTDNKILKADQIIAHHNCNLHGLDNVDHFILVRSSQDDVFTPIHNSYR